MLLWEEKNYSIFQKTVRRTHDDAIFCQEKVKLDLVKQLDQHDKADTDPNPRTSNKDTLVTWLTCNIIISSYSKNLSKCITESKNSKLGYHTEILLYKNYSKICNAVLTRFTALKTFLTLKLWWWKIMQKIKLLLILSRREKNNQKN